MIVVTTETIAGHRVRQTLGQVFGVTVRSRGLGGNFMASLRSIVGGEIQETSKKASGPAAAALGRGGKGGSARWAT